MPSLPLPIGGDPQIPANSSESAQIGQMFARIGPSRDVFGPIGTCLGKFGHICWSNSMSGAQKHSKHAPATMVPAFVRVPLGGPPVGERFGERCSIICSRRAPPGAAEFVHHFVEHFPEGRDRRGWASRRRKPRHTVGTLLAHNCAGVSRQHRRFRWALKPDLGAVWEIRRCL